MTKPTARPTKYRFTLLLGFLLAASPLAAQEEDPDQGLSLLFIGNSLTYTNDLPDMLASLLEWGGVRVDRIETEARPDFGLPDHWLSKTTMRAIGSHDWDYVIFQQGPSATEGRPYLLEYSELFAVEIRKAGARPALFMVWPSAQRLRDFPGVADSYRTAARDVDGLLLPAGEAWMLAWQRDPKLRLYGRDGFHPSRLGTYLAALVIYQALTQLDPRELPPLIPGKVSPDELPEELASLLQEAAVEANAGEMP